MDFYHTANRLNSGVHPCFTQDRVGGSSIPVKKLIKEDGKDSAEVIREHGFDHAGSIAAGDVM